MPHEYQYDAETLRDDVKVKDIFVDMMYGRDLNPSKLQSIIATFDRQAIGVVYLSLRDDGRFACLDGWHRVCATKAVEGNDATIPARIYIDLSAEREAELFNQFNRDRTRLSPNQLFKSRLAAGEAQATAIHEVATSLGLQIATGGSGGGKSKKIRNVATIDYVYSNYGESVLREILTLIRDTMGTEGTMFSTGLMKGLGAFLVRYGHEIDRERLVRVLESMSLYRLQGAAQQLSLTSGVSQEMGFGMAVAQMYNKGLRNKLGDWQLRTTANELRRNGRKNTMPADRAVPLPKLR